MLRFHHFYPKIDSNAHFGSVFSTIRLFNRKTINTVRFYYKNNNTYKFYALTIERDFRNRSDTCEFGRKNKESQTQVTHIATFSQKTAAFIEKRQKLIDFFGVKTNVPINFM